MNRIALINMPFAIANLPSIALTQLRSELRQTFQDQVQAEILYLNHDFASEFGLERYEAVTSSLEATVCGLGDWFFRPLAYPEHPDISEAYFQRYPMLAELGEMLREPRQSLALFLDQLIDQYRIDSFPIVGLTSMFVQNMACIALARRLKQRRPEIITIMGGANCEAPMGSVLAAQVDAVDYVFSGPALNTLPQFLAHILHGQRQQCDQIHGVYSRQKLDRGLNADTEIGADRDINQPPELDFDDFFESVESRPGLADIPIYLPFETSKGCWWGERAHCTFCGLNGSTMAYRAMDADTALKQLHGLFERYPKAKHFHAVDNILPREYFDQLLPRLRAPEGSTIFYEVKADLRREQLRAMATSGITEVQPGIEALNTSTLRLMKKGTTAFQNIDFLKNCVRFGIDPSWNLLIGFPGESEEVYAKYDDDLPRLAHLPPPGGTFPVRFDRYSPYFMRADEYQLKLVPYDSYEILYPYSGSDLNQLAYFFADQNYSAPYLEGTAKWIRKLQAAVDRWCQAWDAGASAAPRLELHQEPTGPVVRDSRWGERREFRPRESELRLLRALEQPCDRTRISTRLSDLNPDEVERSMATLETHDLLFHEAGRWMSLVIDYDEQAVASKSPSLSIATHRD